MDGDTQYSIGQLARRTGLTVKAVRFYADRGLVPPTGRNAAGHRVYDARAAARLELLRTLRELGLDLATIRRVLDAEVTLGEVAAAHADALAVQIRVLRMRQVVLAAVGRRRSTPEEMTLVHELARLSGNERRRLIDDYLTAAFGQATADPAFDGIARSMTPQLPDDPGAEQIEAWVEWAELSADPDFRALQHRLATQVAADRAEGGTTGVRRDAVALVRDLAAPAVAAGVDPLSPHADTIVAAVTARYADDCRLPDDQALRHRLLARLTTAADPRRERHLDLLSVINGWPATPSLAPVLDWSVRALRARVTGAAPPAVAATKRDLGDTLGR